MRYIFLCFFSPEAPPGSQLARHTLSYIQEIGNGWFGQVTLTFRCYPTSRNFMLIIKAREAKFVNVCAD